MCIMKKQQPFVRGAGVLLPVTSLPSPYGIGTLGKAAYAFVDFLEAAGQKYWQVLPIGPTGYGDSPYQSFSAFAGNPYLIDLDMLVSQGLLTPAEVSAPDWGKLRDAVDYAKIYRSRFQVLRQAFSRISRVDAGAYASFCTQNDAWLDGYSLYMALKTQFDGKAWLAWPEDIRLRRPEAVERCRRELAGEIDFWKFCQFQFFAQWDALKAYAHAHGIQIIGDLPIYVSLDSADVWTAPSQFQLDAHRRPTAVAGVPPDNFSATGQLWGNPLYNWEAMQADGFAWWKRRMAFSARIYDIVRIDHFIGIVRYYAIPYGDQTAAHGEWRDGPGAALLNALNDAVGDARIIAEDLGCVVPQVERLRDSAGYPGMRVLEFAFDSGCTNPHLPCHYVQGCVAYGGTHDNETLAGFFAHQSRPVMRFARDYLGVRHNCEVPAACIRAAYASVANTVVIQMQDWLRLGNRARMNFPSTLGGNWRWRLRPHQLNGRLAARIRRLCQTYCR